MEKKQFTEEKMCLRPPPCLRGFGKPKASIVDLAVICMAPPLTPREAAQWLSILSGHCLELLGAAVHGPRR